MAIQAQKQELLQITVTDEDIQAFVYGLSLVIEQIGKNGFKQGKKRHAAEVFSNILEEIAIPTELQDE